MTVHRLESSVAPPPLPSRGSSIPALLAADPPGAPTQTDDLPAASRGSLASDASPKSNTLSGVLTAKRCAAVWRKTAAASGADSRCTTANQAKYFKGIAFQQQTVIEAPHGAHVAITDLQGLAQLAPTRLRSASPRPVGSADPEPLERATASCEDIDRLHKLMDVTRVMNRRRVHTILPYGHRKVWWDRLILACVFYTALSVPFIAGFLTRQNVPRGVLVVQYLIDAVFLLDLPVS